MGLGISTHRGRGRRFKLCSTLSVMGAICVLAARSGSRVECGVGMPPSAFQLHCFRQTPGGPRRKTCRTEAAAAGTVMELQKPTLLRLSPTKAVQRIALPAIGIGILRTFYGLTDAFWLGQCGPTEIEAIGAASFAVWLTLMLSDLGALGVHAEGAALVGRGNEDRVGRIVIQGLHSAWIVGILMACLLPLIPLYLSSLGISTGSAVGVSALGYLRLAFLGTLPMAASAAASSGFKALGEMRPVLLVTIGTVLLNAVVDPMLIRGFGPIPALGSSGAAHATNLSAAIAALFMLLALKRRGIRMQPRPPDWKILRRLFAIGAPITLSGIFLVLVYVGSGHVVNTYGGPAALGAMGIALRVEQVAFVICEGFGIAAATVVGQWLGRCEERKARKAAGAAYLSAAVLMLPFMLLLFFFPQAAAGVFTSDPSITSVAIDYTRVLALCLPFTALDLVYEGAMTGAQCTVYSLVANLLWLPVRVPMAIMLARSGLGIHGVWVAFAVTLIGKSITKWLAFRFLRLHRVRDRRCS